jgi:hypothetical protein
MAVTPEDIANMALAILDEAPIDTLDQDVKAARLLNLHYDQTRQAELTKNTWVFAIFSSSLVGTDLGTDSDTFNWVYELPTDCLRPLPLTYNGEPDGELIGWRQEAGLIYTDQSTPRILRYIANLTDPNDWDALFTEVLVAALAIKIALPLTHKAGMLELARNAYSVALDDALRVNAIQRSGSLYTASWASQRGDTRFWRR